MTEASSTNALKEIGKYFKNVLVGLAEEFLGSFKIADYIYKATSTLVDIGGLIVDMGIASEYDEYYSNGLRKRFDKNFEISDNVKNIAKYINGSDDTLEEKLPSETIATGIYNINIRLGIKWHNFISIILQHLLHYVHFICIYFASKIV